MIAIHFPYLPPIPPSIYLRKCLYSPMASMKASLTFSKINFAEAPLRSTMGGKTRK